MWMPLVLEPRAGDSAVYVKPVQPGEVLAAPVQEFGNVMMSCVLELLTSSNQYPPKSPAPGAKSIGPLVPVSMLLINTKPLLEPLELPLLDPLLEPPELPLLDPLLDPLEVPLLDPPLEPLELPLLDPLEPPLLELPVPPSVPPPLLEEEHPLMTPSAPRPTTATAVRKSFVAMNAPKHLS